MPRDRKDVKEILNKSIDFIKDLSVKVQQEASRTWKLSNLKIEMLGLKRKKNDKLKKLGEKTYSLIKKAKLNVRSLNSIYKELAEIEEKLSEKEEETKRVEKESLGTRFSERQKRVAISKEKKAKGHSKVSSKSIPPKGRISRKTNRRKKDFETMSKKT